MMTTFEKGVAHGKRLVLRPLLEHKFGPLSAAAAQQLETWPPDRLTDLGSKILTARSLGELGLAEEPSGAP
jgi:hypothetical protein